MSSTHGNRPLINVVRLDAAAGKERQLEAAIMGTVAPALATPGNLGFALHASTTHPGQFLIFERWRDAGVLADHAKAPEILHFHAASVQEHLIDGEPTRTYWNELWPRSTQHGAKAAPLVKVVRLTAAAGKEGQLQEAIKATVADMLAAPGNLGFLVHVSTENPRNFLLFGHWADEGSLARHAESPAVLRSMAVVKDAGLMERASTQTHWHDLADPQPRRAAP